MNFQSYAVTWALAGLSFLTAGPSSAQPASAPQISRNAQPPGPAQFAGSLHLAYVRDASHFVNQNAQQGLEALSAILQERTTLRPASVISLDVERDDISFFPVIYWPVTASSKTLSETAQKKVQRYLDGGGFIVFDAQVAGGGMKAVGQMLGKVRMRPLIAMPSNHTLTHSFYISATMPGSTGQANVWVESPGMKASRQVSSVMIGESNWAAAWAGRTTPLNSREREMAIRAGVNMVMYALTGDYKDDFLHAPSLLEKLRP